MSAREVAGRTYIGNHDSSTGILCDPCKGEDEDENALFYCTVCIEFLCESCTRSHRRATLLKHHQLLDRDSMPKQRLTSLESMCTQHNGKLLEYYCQIHDDCCCYVCATLKHRQCKVEFIDDIAKEFDKSKEYKSLLSAIANLTQLQQHTKQIVLKKMDDVGKTHMKFVADVKKFRTEINQILDFLEQSTLLEANTIRDRDTKSTESASRTCDAIMADLEKMSSNMDTQKKYKQQRQLVISARKYQTEIKQYDIIIAELTNQCAIQEYEFRPNDFIIQNIKDANSLGRLVKISKAEGKQRIKRKVIEPEKKPAPSKSLSLRYVDEINIKHPEDMKNCWITGGVMLDNNMLALVDCNNCSVKTVDVNNKKVISRILLATPPWDITRVERDQVVVACINKLVFIKLGALLSVLKKVDIDNPCRGIVYTNNSLVVCCLSPACVNILDLEGHVLKTIALDQLGKPLFSMPTNIALSTNHKTLYVSDRGNNTLISMNIDGVVQHVYTHDKLKEPFGLAVDREGNRYIAGRLSHNIHIMSDQCTTIQVIQDRTPSPQTVIYCERDNILYVSKFTIRTNSISVYQITNGKRL